MRRFRMPPSTSGDLQDTALRRHMLIAGTGRAGTSFLVRYLSALGLETEIERSGQSQWNEEANAGLETMPLLTPGADLPYVIKTPWIVEFADHILKQDAVAIDALIIPVRDLAEAAASRTILERRAIHERAPWMAELDTSHETWGWMPGGLLFSLNPLDQARVLATDFHRLIQRFVDADTPIVFLSFPRLIHDGDYLFSKLRPHLPAAISAEQALAAHRALADPAKVRVGNEMSTTSSTSTHDELDQIAMRRELQRLRIASDQGKAESERLRAELAAESERLRGEVAMLRAALQEQNEAKSRSTAMLDSVILERSTLVKELADLKRSRDALAASLAAARAERDVFAKLHAELAAKQKP